MSLGAYFWLPFEFECAANSLEWVGFLDDRVEFQNFAPRRDPAAERPRSWRRCACVKDALKLMVWAWCADVTAKGVLLRWRPLKRLLSPGKVSTLGPRSTSAHLNVRNWALERNGSPESVVICISILFKHTRTHTQSGYESTESVYKDPQFFRCDVTLKSPATEQTVVAVSGKFFL